MGGGDKFKIAVKLEIILVTRLMPDVLLREQPRGEGRDWES